MKEFESAHQAFMWAIDRFHVYGDHNRAKLMIIGGRRIWEKNEK
jgi:hypothetical protein